MDFLDKFVSARINKNWNNCENWCFLRRSLLLSQRATFYLSSYITSAAASPIWSAPKLNLSWRSELINSSKYQVGSCIIHDIRCAGTTCLEIHQWLDRSSQNSSGGPFFFFPIHWAPSKPTQPLNSPLSTDREQSTSCLEFPLLFLPHRPP